MYSSQVSNSSISSIISVVVDDEVVDNVVDEVLLDVVVGAKVDETDVETAVVGAVDEATKKVSAVVESAKFSRISIVGEVLVVIGVVFLVVVQSSRSIVDTVSVITTHGLLVPFATVDKTDFTVVAVQSFSSGI